MKILCIDCEYYLYPENVVGIDAFARFLENNTGFVKLKKPIENKCVHPYYIFENINDCYLNASQINEFHEDEIVIMNKDEYERHLQNVMKKLCTHCTERDFCLKSAKEDFRDKLSLDCSCFEYCED